MTKRGSTLHCTKIFRMLMLLCSAIYMTLHNGVNFDLTKLQNDVSNWSSCRPENATIIFIFIHIQKSTRVQTAFSIESNFIKISGFVHVLNKEATIKHAERGTGEANRYPTTQGNIFFLYETWIFIILFTWASHRSLSWIRRFHFTPSHSF
jgi:hypothetical protein